MMRITTWTIGLCLAFLVACSSVTAQENTIPTPKINPEVQPGTPGPTTPGMPEMFNNEKKQQSPIAKWPALFDCGPTQVIVAVIKGKYQEQEFILSKGSVQLPDGRILQSPMLFYLNPQTKTFSVVAHFGNGYSCIVASGSEMQPFTGQGQKPQNQSPEGPGLKPGSDKRFQGPYLEARPPIEINAPIVGDDRILALLP